MIYSTVQNLNIQNLNMRGIFAVMNTIQAVVEIRPEKKNCALTFLIQVIKLLLRLQKEYNRSDEYKNKYFNMDAEAQYFYIQGKKSETNFWRV